MDYGGRESQGLKKLFFTKLVCFTLSSEVSQFSCCSLTKEDKGKLCLKVSEEEIRAGLWALKSFKAPGLDSLHAGFF